MAWSARSSRHAWQVAALALVLLAVVAGLVESRGPAPASQHWLVPLVGLALTAGALAMPGRVLARVLLGCTAAGWLLGSLSPWLLVTHQGFLVLVLPAVAGVLHRRTWWLAVPAAAMALGLLDQPLVGLAFGSVGVAVAWQRRTPTGLSAGVAGALVGGTMTVAWCVSRADPTSFHPHAAVLAHEAALVAAAGVLVLGARAEAARGRDLVDRLVAGAGSTGLEGLAAVLADVLSAPGLRVERTPVVDAARGDLPVREGGATVAVVRHPALAALDATTRDDIVGAVRLVLVSEQRRNDLDEQLRALRAAHRRLETAHDQERAAAGARLRHEVAAPLRRAAAVLEGAALGDAVVADPVAVAAVAVARDQMLDVAAGVEALALGNGPWALGRSPLGQALHEMSGRSPVPVEVRIDDTVRPPEEVAATLYYVCAEALVNVHRHASAARATLTLEDGGDVVLLTVADDGVGGADVNGSGLAGLADRVAGHGGRLRVVSPPGAGTTLTVQLPCARATVPPSATSPASGGAASSP
jgi:signal transduction histidine kinase